MSAVQDVSDTFDALVKDVGTTLTLSVGIAVFTFALPSLLQLTQVIRNITTGNK